MDDIIPFDLTRMVFGTAPPLFYLEILTRILIIWVWTLALLRWIGGRSVAQLSLTEFLLVIALGSAVGDGLFYPDVPLFHAMAAILLVVLCDKALDFLMGRSRRAKRLLDGQPVAVLRDGRLICTALKAQSLNGDEVFERLRLEGIQNLAELRLAYLEPSGRYSLLRSDEAGLGLQIMPVPPVDGAPWAEGPRVCRGCGAALVAPAPCPDCGDARSVAAQWSKPDGSSPKRG